VPNALRTCESCDGRGIKLTLRQLGPGMVQQIQSRYAPPALLPPHTGGLTHSCVLCVSCRVVCVLCACRCPDCGGEGQVIRERDRCKKCSGFKVVQERKILEIFVDKGTRPFLVTPCARACVCACGLIRALTAHRATWTWTQE